MVTARTEPRRVRRALDRMELLGGESPLGGRLGAVESDSLREDLAVLERRLARLRAVLPDLGARVALDDSVKRFLDGTA